MGAIFYVILRLVGVADTPFDWIVLCALLTFDQIFWVMVFQVVSQRRAARREEKAAANG